MNRLRPGINFTIFVLFFGLSLLDALTSHQWLRAAFWLAIALAFLWLDTSAKGKRSAD